MTAADDFFRQRPRTRLQRLRWLLPVALVAGTALWVFGPKGYSVEITGKRWQLDIEIERIIEESSSAWCDEMPPGARVLSRRLVSDPRGQRPAPAEHCRYSAPEWRKWRIATRKGPASETPQWPDLELSDIAPPALGAEQPGKRHSYYELLLHDSNGRDWACLQPRADWQRWTTGARFYLQIDRFGTANCASLPAPR
ncbi:hypothetical protein RQP53_04985 [Paucibacter sp. APW11]|uniref:Uncharacterized protein n=1 Tax=Roseateles aquae TaxID=3077235 RepID=A0ABU3P7S8_9BURK|nr:hypothetical protein [Paucibacter sp. APW11]MDT8998622.1 hypothetical protein [Paucibacter sp. APW11]